MLTKESVRALPIGVGVRYVSGYARHALFRGIEQSGSDSEAAVFVTEYGAITKPLLKNYGISWRVEAVNGVGTSAAKSGSDGFYCVRRQRDPEINPGNKPCPDTDKCHLCGAYTGTEGE